MGCCKEPSDKDNIGPEWGRLTYSPPKNLLPEETAARKIPHRSEKRERILAMIGQGKSVAEIAEAMNMDKRLIYASMARYRRKGIIPRKWSEETRRLVKNRKEAVS